MLGAMTCRSSPKLCPGLAAGVGVEVDPALVDRPTRTRHPARIASASTRDGRPLRPANVEHIGLVAYLESGGLPGAIGRQADASYDRLDRQQQETTRRVPPSRQRSDEGANTRRRARRTELSKAGRAGDDLCRRARRVRSAAAAGHSIAIRRAARRPSEVAHEAVLTNGIFSRAGSMTPAKICSLAAPGIGDQRVDQRRLRCQLYRRRPPGGPRRGRRTGFAP